MDAKEFFIAGIDQATTVVRQVSPADFELPTPCVDWDVQQLVGHMLYELAWIPDVVLGSSLAEVGGKFDGDLMGDDLTKSWLRARQKALDAVAEADLSQTARLSYGDVENEEYVWQVSGEMLIHAWDLATGVGIPIAFKPEVARILYDRVKPVAQDLYKSGLFEKPVVVDRSDDLQKQLLGLYGRKS
jgi:uncharacterized protein (TIGR03086 family)